MRAVLFDLDGTLVDSSPDICAAFAVALERHGHPVPDAAEVRALIGRPLVEMFPRFAPEADPEVLIATYREWYLDHCADGTTVHPGAVPLLEALRAEGVPVALATTKPTPSAHKVLEGLGLAHLFDHVQGTDGFPHKPAPDVIHHAVAGLGVRPDGAAWMVGDTVADVAAARAAGLRAAAVTHGTDDAATLAAAGAEVVVDALSELGPWLVPPR